MRHGRSKAARKTLQFFARTQGFRPPYHVLLDGTFLVAMLKYKFPLRERLDKMLQHDAFTLYTTSSCLQELAKLKQASNDTSNKEQAELFQETIQWARRECQVLLENQEEQEDKQNSLDKSTKDWLDRVYPDLEEQIGPPGWDILKLALQSTNHNNHNNNNHLHNGRHYLVACQDETLLDVLRKSGRVPCIRLARGSVLLLENPSKAGQAQDSRDETKKWTGLVIREEERKLVQIVKQERQKDSTANHTTYNNNKQHQQRKKRKAKEPNPLSCKKKTKKGDSEANNPNKKRRRRKNNNGDTTAATASDK
ncbi:UTP23, small subunit (SSU) processome component, homolog (yeast) [Seminavis robusta]|uniref:UTP23, small subunit (SSU) processome component, homolog (Yeast) n=1 Tax=Seminavis robusta TaxID=568900 RepID=A0A9N8EKZ7_9STRA|nr:UTP23, small subunit (SSU) processome component, homolog (yeast) [Seminavis robusta]|eukprot:Sro1384_g268130.1 UTP23, small subunit (SSU) processome component, homolog (yeast) (309) ;mRNA; r:21322-22248